MSESIPPMLQSAQRREAIKRESLVLRDWRDARAVACAQVKVGFGPVEVPLHEYRDKNNVLIKPEATELRFVDKMVGVCLSASLVPVTWEILDNREAIVR